MAPPHLRKGRGNVRGPSICLRAHRFHVSDPSPQYTNLSYPRCFSALLSARNTGQSTVYLLPYRNSSRLKFYQTSPIPPTHEIPPSPARHGQ